jgi:DNA-directed RNA polymerase beta' subunit
MSTTGGGKNDTNHISALSYRATTDEDTLRLAVVQITNHGLFGSDSLPKPGGLYDARMGTIRSRTRCESCMEPPRTCPGHFGYIRLAQPIYHTLYINLVIKLLRCFCFVCAKPMCDASIEPMPNDQRFDRFYATARSRTACAHCQIIQRKYAIKECLIWADRVVIDVRDVRLFLFQLDPVFLRSIGLPMPMSALIHELVLVPPPCIRPVMVVNAIRSSTDDVTSRFVDVLKLTKRMHTTKSQIQRTVITAEIQFIMSMLCLGDTGPGRLKSPRFGTGEYLVAAKAARFGKSLTMMSSRTAVPSLHSRMVGKNGRIRGNLLGKRVDLTARSVATMLVGHDVDVVGIPRYMAEILTKSVRVFGMNMAKCTHLMRTGQVTHLYIVSEDMTIRIDATNRDNTLLHPGDIVQRFLQDGDWIAFGRQPTTRKQSLMGGRVHLVDGLSIRVNTAITGILGLDFDGDELNISVMSGLEADAEVQYLMSPGMQLLSAQSNSACINPIQNSILAVWQLSYPGATVDASIYELICGEMDEITVIRDGNDKPSIDLLSLTLPDGVTAHRFHIFDGQFASNTPQMKKGVVNGLVHHLAFYYGAPVAMRFITRLQRLATVYHRLTGATVGLSDCMLTPAVQAKSDRLLADVTEQMRTTQNPLSSSALAKISSRLTARAAHEMEMRDTSGCLLDMVKSGSKGGIGNLVHIAYTIGQQFVGGEVLKDGGGAASTLETRGFVANSYIKGLTMNEAFSHLVAARDGVTHTSVTTATTGYAWRKLSQALMPAQIAYDRTVRYGSSNRIISLRYGGDGFDGAKCLSTGLPFDLHDLCESIGLRADQPSQVSDVKDCIAYIETHLDHVAYTDAVCAHLHKELPNVGLSRSGLETLAAVVVDRLERAAVEPGEMVGGLAGTMLGEPMQQMTLDAFHHAGAENAGADDGITRLLDLINLRLKLPRFATTYTSPEPMTESLTVAETSTIGIRSVGDVPVDSRCREYLTKLRIVSARRLVIEIVPRGMTGRTLWNAIDRADGLVRLACDTFIYPPEDDAEQWLCLAMSSKSTVTQYRQLVKRVSKCVMTGVSGLGRHLSSTESTHRHDGDAMIELLSIGIMDACSNSITTVFDLLGICGLEAFLMERITDIYTTAGIPIDTRHIRLLVDFMCYDGASPVSLTRHSFNRTMGSTLTRASFEETSRHFANAASHTYDTDEPIADINDAIAVGCHIKGGTHAFELVSTVVPQPIPQPVVSAITHIHEMVSKPRVQSSVPTTEIEMVSESRQAALNFLAWIEKSLKPPANPPPTDTGFVGFTQLQQTLDALAPWIRVTDKSLYDAVTGQLKLTALSTLLNVG